MLKNILIFIAGMVTMLILMVLFGIAVNSSSNSGYPGLTIFEEEGKCTGARQIQIMQTLEPNMALAHAKTQPNAIYDPNEILVLLLGDEKASYYDDQKINVPKGMCAKQVGTYQYQSRELGMKTVPAVTIK
ncbi:putative uncharacterized protein [Clostridium sp. CAG:768]|nr:putative uncharacterized protein [Clostridium sp. CAG:768]